MSRRNRRSGVNHSSEELDLKLNLSPPPPRTVVGGPAGVGPHRMSTSSSSPEGSPPRSCVSSDESLKYSSSPESMSMVLVGCPRCLMYVMLSEADPRCPRCHSTVLVDFLRHNTHHEDGAHGGNNRRGRN